MKTKLYNYFRAGFPGIAIQTTEEARALADVFAAAELAKKAVVVWSATHGAEQVRPESKKLEETEDLLAACRVNLTDTIYILRDVQTWPMDRDPVLCRAFRELLQSGPNNGNCIVLIAPEYKPHSTVERLVTVLDYSLPQVEDLRNIAKGIVESAKKDISITDEVIRALGGLSTTEAENALALSIVETGKLDPAVIYREKVQAVKRSGLLDIVEADSRGLSSIGGLDVLKEWIQKRKRAYSPEAQKYGLPFPKGIMLVGVPGTGKSLSAKAIGTALGVPTVRLDISALFNSLVGESESRTRDALKLAEALAPCVLWVDEIDKGLSGASGSGSGDSGVTRRVFGSIISWLQERSRPVFLVATANQVEGLPPELLRKGRFDEIFALDLPEASDREAILTIHITKKGRDPKQFDLGLVAEVTKQFTGSEIETVIDEAMFNAFDEGKEFGTQNLLEAANRMVPLAKTAKEQIDGIRAWAKTRARFASKPVVTEEPKLGKRKALNID